MNNYISCRKCDKKYCLIYIGHFFIVLILLILSNFLITYNNNDNSDNNGNNDNNSKDNLNFSSHSVFKLFLTYFGMFLCIIPELILKFKTRNVNSENSDIKKNKKLNGAIQYIYTDLSDKTTWKDYIHIGIISFILLLIDFIKIYIEKEEDCANAEYYFTTLPFLLFISIFFNKTEFYKHQYISIIIITIIGIYQYVIKIIFYYNNSKEFFSIIIDLVLQILIGLGEAIFFSYIKRLMNYKFFSPYKVSYIFGLINMIIILIVLFIISDIDCNENDLCQIKYNDTSYFDNIYSIFNKVNAFQIFIIFLISICFGALKLLINLIINYYTVCHIFVFLENNGIADTINQEINKPTNPFIGVTVGISHLINSLFSFVFLEIIELKCFGLNKNYKENIKKRVDEENNRISKGETNNEDENENEEQDNSFSNEDSQD